MNNFTSLLTVLTLSVSSCLPAQESGQAAGEEQTAGKSYTAATSHQAEGSQESKGKAGTQAPASPAADSLEKVYQRILQEYADDPKFTETLKKSQALWEEMREADMTMRFPHKDEGAAFYGSVFSSCYSQIMEDYTMQRIAFLHQWLEGLPEGEVCAGSIRRR